MHSYGFVILAAGSSSRLGKPKQLLSAGSKNLLQHAIEAATGAAQGPVFVVLGAHAEVIEPALSNQAISIVLNPIWHEGMGSSIQIGTSSFIQQHPSSAGIILMVCDQPYLTSFHLRQLTSEHEKSGKGIVASQYRDIMGTPVLFSNRYFEELVQMKGDEGAKKLISRFAADVASVPFLHGDVDIDTVEDYEKLKSAGEWV